MGKDLSNVTTTFFFCDGGSCQKAGSEKVVRAARAYLRNNELWDSTHTIKTRCNGRCEDAPTCIVSPGEFWYKELTPEKIIPILKSHLNEESSLESSLVYQKGWNKLASDNERDKITPKPFQLKNEVALGEHWVTKGFSSDQYLFPLFQYILENKPKGIIRLSTGNSFNLKQIESVVYVEAFTMEIRFIDASIINLTIGAIPKTVSPEIKNEKITSTEYISLISGGKIIQFKNNKGVLIASISFPQEENELWNYCTKIQLGGIVVPELIK